MKFILSFLVLSTILSASNCVKLSLGNAALTPAELCKPVVTVPPTPIECKTPTLTIPTENTINCDKITTTVPIVVAKCTPAPVICPTPKPPIAPPTPVNPGGKCDPSPTSATPEPASYALLGAGFVTAGLARKFGTKK